MTKEWFVDSYTITIVLEDEQGKQRTEHYKGMSLSDFETVYGQINEHIISIEMVVEKNDL